MKKIMLLMVMALLCFAGCDSAMEMMADPNSGLNTAVDNAAPVVELVGSVAPATGTPWGGLVGGAAVLIASLIGVYKNYRKNIVITGKDTNIKNIETTVTAIIKAVEALPDETRDKMKAKIKEKLQDKNFYKIGKAIIAGLKR